MRGVLRIVDSLQVPTGWCAGLTTKTSQKSVGQVLGRAQIIDDLTDLPMFGHSAQIALHQPAGRFLRIAQRLFDRSAVVGLHRPEDRLLLVAVEILDQRNRVVGVELAGDVRDLLRLHLVEQVFADVIVHLREHVGADHPGERLYEPFALVVPGKLDQIGDVGGMERLDKLPRGLVVARLDRIEHAGHKPRAQPIFVIDGGS